MNVLGDDELDLILNRITDPDERFSASLVRKRWLLIEGLTRSSIIVTKPKLLPRFLPRFPNLVMFKTTKCVSNSDLVLLAQTCPKLEVIDLGTVSIRRQVGDEGLCALASGCPKLSEVVLHRRHNVGEVGLVSVITSAGKNLTHLDLGFCCSVSDNVLGAIGSSSCSISTLILDNSKLITDVGLRLLADGCCVKTMKRLILTGCTGITDSGVLHLHKMSGLEELNLEDCSGHITDIAGVAISAIPTLKKLLLGSLRLVTNITIIALFRNCLNLEMLDLRGCWVTGAGIRRFSGHRCLQTINLSFCYVSYIRGDELERLVLECPSLKSIVLDDILRKKILSVIEDGTVSRLVEFI